jgi:hypothetical protein
VLAKNILGAFHFGPERHHIVEVVQAQDCMASALSFRSLQCRFQAPSLSKLDAVANVENQLAPCNIEVPSIVPLHRQHRQLVGQCRLQQTCLVRRARIVNMDSRRQRSLQVRMAGSEASADKTDNAPTSSVSVMVNVSLSASFLIVPGFATYH